MRELYKEYFLGGGRYQPGCIAAILWKFRDRVSHCRRFMFRIVIFLLPASIFLICSCNKDQGYHYAIKDFRKSLQPHLIRIVATGVVMYGDSALENMATDKELMQLLESEHPVLRATAFREMNRRKTFNHFEIVVNHLDDTADVATYAGEFGIWHRTVSDDMLQEAKWKTREDKNKTVDRVLANHNNLRSAYTILVQLEPQEKYYAAIKDMSIRSRLDFNVTEYALYGLAKFKKPDDTRIIVSSMMQNIRRLSDVSFRLMKEFPEPAYFEVLQEYHRRQFYKFSGNRPYGFSGYVADRAAPEDFIEALVKQKNERSAKLLDTMLTKLPKYNCLPDRRHIINEVIEQVWENPCPAYATLRKKIRSRAEAILKRHVSMPAFTVPLPPDTIERKYQWYY